MNVSTELEARRWPGGRSAPLSVIAALGDALEDAAVSYCHWKSNAQIFRSERGENDLDLLVARADERALVGVLSNLGFIRVTRPGRPVPGIESFYAYDAEQDVFVHAHVHHRLVLGHDATKNVSLPIEQAYLASATRVGALRLPDPAFEFVVLVLRLTLKHCIIDEEVWQRLRGTRAQPKRSEREELEFLSACVDERRIDAIVARSLPFVSADLFAECRAAVEGRRRFRARVRAGRRLERALRPGARRGPTADASRRVAYRVQTAYRNRLRSRRVGSRLTAGGAIVALIGGDGAGKSTALNGLEAWLGRIFEVRLVHLGKPPWSMTTYAVRGSLKFLVAVASLGRRLGADRLGRRLEELRPLVWLVCTARDRSRLYRRAHQAACDGCVVLCDRYPHDLLRTMEVPQIRLLAEAQPPSEIVTRMARWEERFHARIGPPDIVAVLLLEPEKAVRRKTTEPPDTVRARSSEIWSADWVRFGVHVVDADRAAPDVLAELKEVVWRAVA